MKLILLLLAAATVVASFSAQATTITLGSLSREDGNSIIVDTLNSREWLGFDVTKGLTYAQTLAAIEIGGVFEGYSIARNIDAQMFTDAMSGERGTGFCTVSDANICVAGNRPGIKNAEKIVGESYINYRTTLRKPHDYDVAFFLSDNGTGEEVGWLQVYTEDNIAKLSDVFKANEWGSIADSDMYANFSVNGIASPIGWLLYREVNNTVPEPSNLALFGLALLSISGVRYRGQRYRKA